MTSYFTNLKRIFLDILLLYKNFLHWNISKICIFLWANIVGFIASLPFIGIIVYQYFTNYINLSTATSQDAFVFNNIGTLIVTTLLILGVITIFISTYTYGNFLMMNVYKWYLEEKKLPYTKNLYFSWKHFSTYMGILAWILLYMLIPISIGIIFVIPFGMIAEMSTGIYAQIIWIISLLIFIILCVWFFVLTLRLSFSYYVFLYSDSEEIKKAKTYIHESFQITRKKVWKIIFLCLPFFVIIGIMLRFIEIEQANIIENPKVFAGLFALFSFLVFNGLTSMIYLAVYQILKEEYHESIWLGSRR